MEHSADGRVLVISDTCILINFLRVGRFDLLCKHRSYRIVITEHVRAEVMDPNQALEIEVAIAAGDIEEVVVTDPMELTLFAELNAVLGRGESAAIAVAVNRGWAIATDEGRRCRREINTRLGPGRLLTTPGIILKSIQNGDLTVADADAIKLQLEAHRFKMNFASFANIANGDKEKD